MNLTINPPVHRLHREASHGVDRLGLVVLHLERLQRRQANRVLQHPHAGPMRLLQKTKGNQKLARRPVEHAKFSHLPVWLSSSGAY